MENQYLFLIFIGAVASILIAAHFNHQRKLKRNIQKEWGEIPKATRVESEKSLYRSYETLKSHLNFDSEVDDMTWYDLDLYTVFQRINHTRSSIGSEALYRRLRQFDLNNDSFKRVDAYIKFYENNPETREEMEYTFARLGKKNNHSVVRYLTTSVKKRISTLAFYILLGVLPLIGLFLILLDVDGLGFALLFGSATFNLIYSTIKKTALNMELMSMGYLIQSLNTAHQLTKINHPLQEEIKERLRPFKGVRRFSFAFQANENSEAGILLDYLNMLFMLPFIAYHFVFNQIKAYEKEALELWLLLGDLEVAYAILNYRLTLPVYVEPAFTEGNHLTARNVYHPLVDDPVPNPVYWTENTLVSGSNASGKSTYVKSVAINCILAQTIHTCLASEFSMKRGHVLTSMAVEDDVVMGDSYFMAEIKSLKRVLKQVKTQERCYLFIDEILRGTNTVERIAASSSIIDWINDSPSLAFVATHDIELTEILKGECTNVHFKETVTEEEGIQFDYQVRRGPATSRNAILLLHAMDFPEQIVKKANRQAQHFDLNKVWPTLT